MNAAAGRQEPPVVLVADDEEDILELVRFDLEAEGYGVVTARDGTEALRLALEHMPGVAILDVLMPGLGGFEVTQRVRESKALDGTAVILLTARSGIVDILEGFRAGADDYLTKPFEPEELRTRVRVLLERREALRPGRRAGD
jgi:DNA-binding response OmpR family regulator